MPPTQPPKRPLIEPERSPGSTPPSESFWAFETWASASEMAAQTRSSSMATSSGSSNIPNCGNTELPQVLKTTPARAELTGVIVPSGARILGWLPNIGEWALLPEKANARFTKDWLITAWLPMVDMLCLPMRWHAKGRRPHKPLRSRNVSCHVGE